MKTKGKSKYSKDVISIREFIDRMNNMEQILNEAFRYEEEDIESVGDNTEEPMMDDEGVGNTEMAGMQYVDQIRKAAIEGIEAFVDNVDSPSYDFFKKVFMMADKVLSEKDNAEGDVK